MKITKYCVAFLVLLTGFLSSCKKETNTEEIGVEAYDTSVTDTTSITDENSGGNVSGAAISPSGTDVPTKSGGNNAVGTGKSSNSDGSSSSSGPTGRNSKNDAVDMTKDTIMTPAGKFGGSGTPGSGRGNSKVKAQGTGTGTNASQGSSTGK